MANNSVLKGTVNDYVKQNGAGGITGQGLQTILDTIIDSLGGKYQYAGVAAPSTNPGTPDQNVFYLAATAGTYTNFGGIVLADGEVAVIKGSGSSWTKEVTGIASAEEVSQLGQEIIGPIAEKSVSVSGTTAETTGIILRNGVTYNIYVKCSTAVTSGDTGVYVFGSGFTKIQTITAEQYAAGYSFDYTASGDVTLWVRPYAAGTVLVKVSSDVVPINLNEIKQKTENYDGSELLNFNIGQLSTKYIENSYVNKNNGSFVDYAGWNRSDYINVSVFSSLVLVTTVASAYNAFYDKNKQFIEAFSLQVGSNALIIPPYAYYMVISGSSSINDTIFYIDKYSILTETTAGNKLVGLIDIQFTQAHYINPTTGAYEVATSTYRASETYYDVRYVKNIIYNALGTGANCIVCFYDNDRQVVSTIDGPQTDRASIQNIEVPSGAIYARFAGRTNIADEWSNVYVAFVLDSQKISRTLAESNSEETGIMAVNYNKNNDLLCLGSKYDANNDLLIHFKHCMFNNLMTFYKVGLSSNTDSIPLSNPQRTIETVLNETDSDNIGPVGLSTGYVGGNHSLNNDHTTKTAKTDSYEIFVDGKKITNDFSGYAKSVIVRVYNTLYDPTSPVVDNILTTPAIKETVIYRVEKGDISVMMNHKYLEELVVSWYGGMQSMFYPTDILTPNGVYEDWTDEANVVDFKKVNYPNFNAFFQKNANGVQVVWLDTDYGIGDHSLINDSSEIFHKNGHKLYHELIVNKTIPINSQLNWRGVYSWNKQDSETGDYINFKIRNWEKDYYYIATKDAYNGDVPIINPDNIGEIEQKQNAIQTSVGVFVQSNSAGSIVLQINP